tara:strand:- start:6162 stop:7019 length:858 start_codon:yes stop_codon:yes gene_type:complete
MHKKNYGRGGDTEIRKIKGKESHLTAFESYLVDTLKDKGEDMVLSFVNDPSAVYGSGTTNPMTNLKEYGLKDWWNKNVGNPAKKTISNVTDGSGFQFSDLNPLWEDSIVNPKNAWDHTLGNDGIGGWLSGAGDNKAFSFDKDSKYHEKKAADKAIDGGMKSIQTSLDKNLGEGGFLDQKQSFAMDQNTLTANTNFQKARNTADNMISKSDFASNTGINRMEEQSKKIGLDSFNMGQQKAFMERDQSETELLQRMNMQYNALLTDYKSATDKDYKGDTSELDSYFS